MLAAVLPAAERPRAIFLGTPELAVPSLDALTKIADVTLVVAQPDRPAGRGHKLTPPPVKVRALELGIPVIQPTKVRVPEFAEAIAKEKADVALVVAYGRILVPAVLAAPRRGCVNVHASILPRWRGAAPIQWAVASGDRETGVCLMQMDEGLDTGAVIASRRTAIGPDETAGELGPRLALLGAELVAHDLLPFVEGRIGSSPQPKDGATLARLLEKSDAKLAFDRPAQAVHDHARGMHPWPGAETSALGKRLRVHRTRVAEAHGVLGPPGTVRAIGEAGLEVACAEGSVLLALVQLDGKKPMSARELVRGHPIPIGTVLGGDVPGAEETT
jgi:methionyl-tRNA formyltransferase